MMNWSYDDLQALPCDVYDVLVADMNEKKPER
jgi:hypothetical protein